MTIKNHVLNWFVQLLDSEQQKTWKASSTDVSEHSEPNNCIVWWCCHGCFYWKPMLHLLCCIKSTLDLFYLNEWYSHEKTENKSTTLETTVPTENRNREGLGLWARATLELQANDVLLLFGCGWKDYEGHNEKISSQ